MKMNNKNLNRRNFERHINKTNTNRKSEKPLLADSPSETRPNISQINLRKRSGSKTSKFTRFVAAFLLFATLATAIFSTTPNARAEESLLPTPTVQLAKEYIYAGSRMLAIEDYGITPSPSPTPTP